MDTTQTLSATSLAAAAATAAGARAEEEAVSQGDAFALLLRSLGNRFETNAAPLDPNAIRAERTRPEPKPVDARDDRRAERDDNKADAADRTRDTDEADSADRSDAKDAADTGANEGNSAAEAETQVDAVQAAQLAAIQAQLIANTTTPVVQAVQTQIVVAEAEAVTAAPVVAQVDAGAEVTGEVVNTTAPTGPVAEVVAQVADTAAPRASDRAVAAIQQVAPEQAQADARSAVILGTGPKHDPAALAQAQDATTEEMPILPQANQLRAAASQQTPAAKAQSEALSRLLGADNQIKIAVNIEAARPATPSLNPYNHFIGYSMDAAPSLANGGLGTALATDAPSEDGAPSEAAPRTTMPAPNATTAALAALATGPSAPAGTTTQGATAPVQAPAISSVAQPQGAGLQSDAGQAGVGQGQTGTSATGQSAATNGTEAAKQAPPTAQIFDQIKVHITRATKAGLDHVTIQLRPDDLGRVEVKLEMTQDGKVHALVIADKPETLQLMQSDARGLERALNDAGLRTDANALEFSLRGDNGAQSETAGAKSNGGTNGADAGEAADELSYDYSRAASLRGGVDTYA